MAEIKMCVFCEHCDHEEGIDYGGQTGYQEGSYRCEKGHFAYEGETDFNGWALKAMTCKDYELSHEVVEELTKRGLDK